MLPPDVDWKNNDQVTALKKTTKANLRKVIGSNLEKTWGSITKAVEEESERIAHEEETLGSAIPQVKIEDIHSKQVPERTLEAILRRGAAVIRGVYPREQMKTWFKEISAYIEDNHYHEQDIDPNLDQYFANLKSTKPQIFNVYWSKPQMEIRQHPNMLAAKVFLNHLWKYQKNGTRYFEPDKECIYADRVRIRAPGDTTLGLSPHIDGGSIERWVDDANQKIYEPIFRGEWEKYDPFDGAYRNEVQNIPSPAVCRAFRTYQGWVAMTQQGPGDGTLKLIPMVKASTAYLLMRPFMEDVAEEIFCGAEPAHAQAIEEEWHQKLLNAMVSIPLMMPGDTVWWHHDLVHAVENEHHGEEPSSVTYVGAAPYCARNEAYLKIQQPSFLEGLSSPDFAPEHREKNYTGRCQMEDLTELGKKEMGFVSW